MTAKEILAELKLLGSDSYKRVVFNHGVKEPCFGVKVSDLQKIQKRIKKDHQLALDLYDTGNYDAMYLAGLIADDAQMTKKVLPILELGELLWVLRNALFKIYFRLLDCLLECGLLRRAGRLQVLF